MEPAEMGNTPTIETSGRSETARKSLTQAGAIAEQACSTTSLFRDPTDAPEKLPVKVLLKTETRVVLVGIIFADGTPGIYDFCGDRYIRRDDWHGIDGWMPLPE